MERQLREGLSRLADLLDPDHLRAVEGLQEAARAYHPVERIPVVMLGAGTEGVQLPEWPLYAYHESLDNPEKMLWNELLRVFIGVTLKDDRIMTIRANYGAATVASLFGAPVKCTGDSPPWVEPLHSSQAMREIVERGTPDLTTGLGGSVLETQRLYRDYLAEYPSLDQHVHIFPSGSMGAFDTALNLWGSEIYLAMYDEPELVHAVLDLITETTIAFVTREKEIVGEALDQTYQYWYRIPGGGRVCDDTVINVSPAMYAEFSRPYNERILAAFGGGFMHYCGHGLQCLHLQVSTRGLRGIELGYNNSKRNPSYTLEAIYREAAKHRVALLWGQEGLPHARPAISTGLIYRFQNPDLPWEYAVDRLEKARTFWSNLP